MCFQRPVSLARDGACRRPYVLCGAAPLAVNVAKLPTLPAERRLRHRFYFSGSSSNEIPSKKQHRRPAVAIVASTKSICPMRKFPRGGPLPLNLEKRERFRSCYARPAGRAVKGKAPVTSPRRFLPPWQVEADTWRLQGARRFRPSTRLHLRQRHPRAS